MLFRHFLLYILLLFSFLVQSQSPESVALKLCKNFDERSNFTLSERVTNGIQQGILVIYLPPVKEWQTIETVVTISKLGGNYLNVSANPGEIQVWRDDELLIEGETATASAPLNVGENYFREEYREALPPFQGDYKIRIIYKPQTAKSTVFLWVTDESQKVQQNLSFRSNWDYTEPHLYRFQNGVVDNTDGGWKYPSEVLSAQFSNDEAINDWTAANGLMLEAMWAASLHFEQVDSKSFVEKHLNFFVEEISNLESASVSVIEPPFYQHFRYQGLEDFGLQTVPFFNSPSNEAYKSFTSKGSNRVLYKSIRSPDGLLTRQVPDSLTVWADDLYFATALLCKAYATNKSRKYLEEAVKQVILFDSKLKDRYSRLYWHGYSLTKKEHSSSKFARANGLTILAKAELLNVLPETHPEREAILKMFRDQAEAIKTFQSLDGRWHQVLDNKEAYLETSATAMFVTAFAEGITNNWLYNKEQFKKSVISGWLSITSQVDEKGNLAGISPEIGILDSDQEYADAEPKTNQLIGLGAVLQAAIAMDKLNKQ